MPLPSSPPYVSVSRPRQLNRWLDINSQNGPLSRTQTFFTMPAFSVDVNWLGYSDIVAAFNFEGPNNFSLRFLQGSIIEGLPSDIQKNPNYCLCIMWIDSTTTPYTVHRYAIWQGVGEVQYLNIPLYTGQLIKKNFRLEVWSVAGQAVASQSEAINFYTSKLGIVDYRHGLDTALVSADTIVTQFSVGANNAAYPADMGLLLYSDSPNEPLPGPPITWATNLGGNVWNQTGTHATIVDVGFSGWATIAGGNCIQITNSDTYYTLLTNLYGVQSLTFLVNMQGDAAANTAILSAYPTGIALFWNNGTVSSGGGIGPSVTGLSTGTWYTMILFLYGSQMSLYVYDTRTGNLVTSNTSLAPAVTFTNVVQFGNAPMTVGEIALGSNTLSPTDLNTINNYMTTKYFTGSPSVWGLPFVWPAGAVPQFN